MGYTPRGSALRATRQFGVLLAIVVLALAPAAHATSAGDLDASFFGDGTRTYDVFGGVDDDAGGVAIQPDGKIVVAGRWCGFAQHCTTASFAVARFNPNGSLDTSFGDNGRTLVSFSGSAVWANDVAIQGDGKIVVAGMLMVGPFNEIDDFALARLEPDGDLDPSFSGDGKQATGFGGHERANSVAIQANGRIVVAGWTDAEGGDHDFALARYTGNGTLDSTFDGDGRAITGLGGDLDDAEAVAIQGDGKIVAMGDTDVHDDSDIALARYHVGGGLDTSFDDDGKVVYHLNDEERIWDGAFQPDGKAVVAGDYGGPGAYDFLLARFTVNGSQDVGFEGGALTTDFGGDEIAWAIAIQANGRIVAGGNRFGAGFALARYHTNGALDSSFGGDGLVTTTIGFGAIARALAIQRDGKIVAAGDEGDQTDNDFALARYHAVTDNTPPQTTITSGPGAVTNDPTPTFGFASSEPFSSFQCSVDGGSFWPCTSPARTPTLADGAHSFRVRAIDGSLNVDPTPAVRAFTVDTAAPGVEPPPSGFGIPAPSRPGSSGGSNVINGTPGDDILTGTPGPDVINCGAGDDVVRAGAGDDVINCGDGNDRVDAGSGNDRVKGESGGDRLSGKSGRDRLSGGTGSDRLWGNSGRDLLSGSSGNDRLSGGPGSDRLSGGSGRDRLKGDSGNDRLKGGRGRDRLRGGPGRDKTVQ